MNIKEAEQAIPLVLVVGTFDTKTRELLFLQQCLERNGVRAVTIDLSTSSISSTANVTAWEVARHHPSGSDAVFTGDRGSAITGMALAFTRFLASQSHLAGIIGAGGSGGTALITPGLRSLPIGVPKVLVSTMLAVETDNESVPTDISMVYSVLDISGLNRISTKVLSNAANALAGMIKFKLPEVSESLPALGLTMFGVTTPCVSEVSRRLDSHFDCLVFHATGTGGRSMEKLVDSGMLAGVLDITPTENAGMLVGGVFPSTKDRFGAVIRTGVPYIGSCGAVDMVNFGRRESVPQLFAGRNLYVHNPSVTLMRTTAAENAAIGQWIALKLNQMEGPVRFFFPLKGVSSMDAPGMPFYDPVADQAFFDSFEAAFAPTPNRQLIKLNAAINDIGFAEAIVQEFHKITCAL